MINDKWGINLHKSGTKIVFSVMNNTDNYRLSYQTFFTINTKFFLLFAVELGHVKGDTFVLKYYKTTQA